MRISKELRDQLGQAGPSHPEWDSHRCGFVKRSGMFCMSFKALRPDGSRRLYCYTHMADKIETAAGVISRGHIGRSSYVLREEISAKFNSFMEDMKLLDLKEELALFKAYLGQGIEKWQQNEEGFTLAEADWVFNRIDRLSRLIETIVRIRNDTALTVAEVHYLQLGVATVLKEFVPQEKLQKAIERIYELTAKAEHTEVDPYYDTVENGVVKRGDCPLGEFEYVLNPEGVLGAGK